MAGERSHLPATPIRPQVGFRNPAALGRYISGDTPRQPSHLIEIWPGWMVDDYDPAVGEGLDRMTDIARHNRNQTCAGDLGHAVDGHAKLALYHLVNFFLSMNVLMNGRTAREVVVCECHISVDRRRAYEDVNALCRRRSQLCSLRSVCQKGPI